MRFNRQTVRWIALVGLGLVTAASLFLGRNENWGERFSEYSEKIASWGIWGPIIVGSAFIPACVFLLPGSPITIVGGLVFGQTFTGFLLVFISVSVGSTAGATIAFLLARFFLRETISVRTAQSPQFKRLDLAVRDRGFRIVLLSRLSPLLPFNVLNYALGLTSVSTRDYILASWLGMMPGTMLFCYLGASLGTLAEVVSGSRPRSIGEQILFGVGLVATLALTVVLGRIAKQALNDPPPTNNSHQS